MILAGDPEDRWELQQITLSSGAVVDVDVDHLGGAHCSGKACRHLQVQPALDGLEHSERWRCGLTDGAPPVPPNDFCTPHALDVVELLHRRRRRSEGYGR